MPEYLKAPLLSAGNWMWSMLTAGCHLWAMREVGPEKRALNALGLVWGFPLCGALGFDGGKIAVCFQDCRREEWVLYVAFLFCSQSPSAALWCSDR